MIFEALGLGGLAGRSRGQGGRLRLGLRGPSARFGGRECCGSSGRGLSRAGGRLPGLLRRSGALGWALLLCVGSSLFFFAEGVVCDRDEEEGIKVSWSC